MKGEPDFRFISARDGKFYALTSGLCQVQPVLKFASSFSPTFKQLIQLIQLHKWMLSVMEKRYCFLWSQSRRLSHRPRVWFLTCFGKWSIIVEMQYVPTKHARFLLANHRSHIRWTLDGYKSKNGTACGFRTTSLTQCLPTTSSRYYIRSILPDPLYISYYILVCYQNPTLRMIAKRAHATSLRWNTLYDGGNVLGTTLLLHYIITPGITTRPCVRYFHWRAPPTKPTWEEQAVYSSSVSKSHSIEWVCIL